MTAADLLQQLLTEERRVRGGSYMSDGDDLYEMSPGQLSSHVDYRVAMVIAQRLADSGFELIKRGDVPPWFEKVIPDNQLVTVLDVGTRLNDGEFYGPLYRNTMEGES